MLDESAKFKNQIENARRKISRLNGPVSNREAILRFADTCFSEGLSPRRVLKYLSTLANIAAGFPTDFTEATRADIEELVGKIERSDYAEWTKHDYRVALKKFFRWLRQTEEYPPEVRWLRSTMKNGRTKLPEEILTQQEVQAIIVAARTARDRAFIAVLYESGCRIGEVLSLRMRQVQQHPHGFQITVSGKTGNRRLLLIASAPYLTAWLNQHPRREDPQSPLWPISDYRSSGMSYGRACDVIKATAKRAGVRTAVNPHNFRHSRATHLANHLTEAQMKEYFGWVQGSDMASIYVHLSGRDIDNALLKLNNIQVPEDGNSTNGFSLRACQRCSLANPPGNKFCSRCGAPLDEQTAREIVQRDLDRSRADQIMDSLIQDQEFRAVLERKLKELSGAKT
jgi:site-specific recombinase XerD